jgi:hypothetical protein
MGRLMLQEPASSPPLRRQRLRFLASSFLGLNRGSRQCGISVRFCPRLLLHGSLGTQAAQVQRALHGVLCLKAQIV